MVCALDLESISIIDTIGFQRFVHKLNKPKLSSAKS